MARVNDEYDDQSYYEVKYLLYIYIQIINEQYILQFKQLSILDLYRVSQYTWELRDDWKIVYDL